jgi:hypothetical protein
MARLIKKIKNRIKELRQSKSLTVDYVFDFYGWINKDN